VFDSLQPWARLKSQRMQLLSVNVQSGFLSQDIADGGDSMIEVNRLHGERRLIQEDPTERERSVRMRQEEAVAEVGIYSLDALLVNGMDVPVNLHAFLQIPCETPEARKHDLGCLGRPPDDIGLGGPGVGGPEECIEPADVIDVEMGKQEMIDTLDLGAPQGVDTTLAAVEEETMYGLPRMQPDEERIVAAGQSQHVRFNAHGKSRPRLFINGEREGERSSLPPVLVS